VNLKEKIRPYPAAFRLRIILGAVLKLRIFHRCAEQCGVFSTGGRGKRFAAARKTSIRRFGWHPWGEWMGMNRKRAEGAACAFLNSYFAFGTYVGI
jgi:hypothetical protein